MVQRYKFNNLGFAQAQENDSHLYKDLFKSLREIGAKRMVAGHTPLDKGQIYTTCDEKYYVIDSRISRSMREGQFSGILSALSISPDDDVEILRQDLDEWNISLFAANDSRRSSPSNPDSKGSSHESQDSEFSHIGNSNRDIQN